MPDFAETLQRYMRGKVGAQKLSNLTQIPKTKIDSWLQGRVQRPRDWRPILTIAQTLLLTRDETETLLLSAGQPPLTELAEQIAPNHPDRCYLQPWVGAAAVTPSARHQLRAPVGDFVGRAAELAALAEALCTARRATGVAAIAGVQGMGGVGKTELAYAAAHQVRHAFPDAQIVVALRGASPAPLAPEQVLQTVIRAFTPEATLPDDLPALEALYRAQLHAKRVLILADDARDAAQIRPLLPPAGSALLVTSRTRFTLPAMTALDLEQLAVQESHALLRSICGRLTDEETAELARACCYLPLALRVSGSLLQTSPALAVRDYLARLTDERQRLAALRDPDDPQLDVEASLALSYAQLDAGTQAVFRQLGVLVADFSVELAQAAVAAPDGGQLAATMHQLLRRNLVLYDAEHRRWRLHDLVRDLARQRLEGAGETNAAQWRYARAVVAMAQSIQDQFVSGGDTTLTALAQFDAERPHIDATYHWSLRHAQTPDGDQFLLDVTLATRTIGALRYDQRHDLLPRWEGVRAAARRLGNRVEEARALNNLGIAYDCLGDTQTAISYYQQRLTISHALGDRVGEANTLNNVGLAYANLGELSKAISYYEQALAIARDLDIRMLKAHTLNNLGEAHTRLGKIHRAIGYYEQALAIVRALGRCLEESIFLGNLSSAYTKLGDTARAIGICSAALTIVKTLKDRRTEGYLLGHLACAHALRGDSQHATATFGQAVALLRETGDRTGEAECSWNFGLALARQGISDEVLRPLRAAVAYEREIGHSRAAEHAALLAILEATGALPPEVPRGADQAVGTAR
jgi:tetratricopeptide (TPR) repeat protein